jgi:predicted KAP-like P-loop ATPase
VSTKQNGTLAPPRNIVIADNPFHEDLFDRRKLAERLTGYIERLRDGTVLAIDAPWGEGKSWFGRNWATDLRSKGYRVIFLDAFQQDYVEDPFLLIASEISELLKEDETQHQALKERAASVMKSMIPIGTKALLSIAGRVALGSADLSKELTEAIQDAGNSATDATQKWLENKIEAHSQEKASLENFRISLQEFCALQEKPVVFFIDELDRCRPTFAVRLIERIKHFFDVPNLVFVLLLNRDQLQSAVKGVYGAETDAAAYLGKFVHMFLKLPKSAEATGNHSNANWRYLNKLAEHYKFERSQPLEEFISSFSVVASLMKMSLRDLERGMALLALNEIGSSAPYLAWPIALKLKHPDIFAELLNDEKSAHKKAADLLQPLESSEQYHFWLKRYFWPFHIIQSGGGDTLTDLQIEEMKQYSPSIRLTGCPLRFWLKRLDIAIQD